MLTRAFFVTTAVVSLAASTAIAASLTDRGTGKFLCAEHRAWTAVAPADLSAVHPGDIVKLDGRGGSRPRLTVLRRAADEIASPEL